MMMWDPNETDRMEASGDHDAERGTSVRKLKIE